MKKLSLLLLVILSFSSPSFSQKNEDKQYTFENKDRVFKVGETIKFKYNLDKLELLNSNFGGCGNDLVYNLICHSDSLFSEYGYSACDYLLMEYWYSRKGSFEKKIHVPGTYSVEFYVKKQKKMGNTENRFEKTISSPKFTINKEEFDQQVIQIINKHSNLKKFGGFVEYHKAFDTILNEINNLDFVTDAYFDQCAEKLSIYPGHSTLGVKFIVNGVSIEKCYDIQVGEYSSRKNAFGTNVKNNGNLDKLKYLKTYFMKGFIEYQRELCKSK